MMNKTEKKLDNFLIRILSHGTFLKKGLMLVKTLLLLPMEFGLIEVSRSLISEV